MNVTLVSTSITVMGVIIALGMLFAWKVPISQDVKKVLILIILNIAVPSIILNGVFNTDVSGNLLNQAFLIFMISIIFHIGALLFAWLIAKLFRFESTLSKKLVVLAALGNTGFIGIPLAATIFGPVGGLLAAIFDAALDLVLFTIVIAFLQSGSGMSIRSVLKSFINVPLIAITVGLTSAVVGFEPPAFARQLTEHLAGLAAPLAMLYIGMLLQGLFKRSGVGAYRQIWFPLTVRLLAIPLMTMFVLSWTPLSADLKNLVIILSAMPTFTLSAILFARYLPDKDENTAVITIAYSTLLSLLTIPFITWLAAVWF
ncbi:hypothetical protein BBEV_0519 [Salisediminibacterium beveridgei]|uniref:Transporter n=2 Tax=Salisediminibacterium beveridgei TaxID=632773 RepID=A0A1D7QSC4_9BACI|nr:hypothetical protein BBEV_0519 [Salisediminibacterium beveridgei]